jgi:hypothetical protein
VKTILITAAKEALRAAGGLVLLIVALEAPAIFAVARDKLSRAQSKAAL